MFQAVSSKQESCAQNWYGFVQCANISEISSCSRSTAPHIEQKFPPRSGLSGQGEHAARDFDAEKLFRNKLHLQMLHIRRVFHLETEQLDTVTDRRLAQPKNASPDHDLLPTTEASPETVRLVAVLLSTTGL